MLEYLLLHLKCELIHKQLGLIIFHLRSKWGSGGKGKISGIVSHLVYIQEMNGCYLPIFFLQNLKISHVIMNA